MTVHADSTAKFREARDHLVRLQDDYASAYETFEWPELEYFNFGLDWFDVVASQPDREDQNALVIVEEDGSSQRVTFKEMSARTNQLANWLESLGVERGGRILVMLDNQVEMWEIMLAGIKMGAVLLPTTTMLAAHSLQERVDRGEVSWVVTNPANTAKFAEVTGSFTVLETGTESVHSSTGEHAVIPYRECSQAPSIYTPKVKTRADETLLLYFTSGTTSRAKLVEHTHASYPVGHLSTMYWIGLEPGDVHLNVASPGWAKHAWSNFFTPWIAEATVFIYNYARFDAIRLMELMDQEAVTSFCAPPTVWRMFIQADLSRLKTPPRKVVAAGEPLNPKVIEHVQEVWNVDIRDGFGQTETTVQIANTPSQPLKVGAVGRSLPGFKHILVEPESDQVIEGAGEGEVCISLDPRPVGLLVGYYGDPERTQEAFRNGLYHTGDVMSRDDDGRIAYVGRADDVFKASDYKLSPFELESAVIQHPAVAEAAVVPSPDPIRLAVPKAYVVLAADQEPSDALAEEILAHCRKVLPPYARIRRLEFTDVPKTVSGKIRRVELRAREREIHGEEGALVQPRYENHEYQDSDFPSLKLQ